MVALTEDDMTAKEAVEKLNALTNEDPETAHVDAEDIVLELLRTTGFKDVAKAYKAAIDRCGFWYA